MVRGRVTAADHTARAFRIASVVTALLFAGGCFTSNAVRRSELQRLSTIIPPPLRPVVVIPGFGHSRLYDPVTQRFVWGTGRATMTRTFPDDFDLPIDPRTSQAQPDRLVPRGFVGSRGPINAAYHICQALELYGHYDHCSEDPTRRSSAYAFAYDWRLSHAENARRLTHFIDDIRRAHRDPFLSVDIVAHSDGGLVAVALMRLFHPIDREPQPFRRLVLIATPLRGTLEAFRLLNEPEKFIRRELAPRATATFPSIAELLPTDGEVILTERGVVDDDDVRNPKTWQSRHLSIFGAASGDALLQRAFAAALDKSRAEAEFLSLRDSDDVVLIAGGCVPTAHSVLVRDDSSYALYPSQLRENEKQFAKLLFEPGDGSVLLSSATDGRRAATLCDGHQGIALDPSTYLLVLRALSDPDRHDIGPRLSSR